MLPELAELAEVSQSPQLRATCARGQDDGSYTNSLKIQLLWIWGSHVDVFF